MQITTGDIVIVEDNRGVEELTIGESYVVDDVETYDDGQVFVYLTELPLTPFNANRFALV